MITGLESDGTQDEMVNIYKLFLLGSENMGSKLVVTAHSQLKAVMQVLKQTPTCLDQVQKIEMEIYEDGMLECAIQVILNMIL